MESPSMFELVQQLVKNDGLTIRQHNHLLPLATPEGFQKLTLNDARVIRELYELFLQERPR
jgi:hypothetical protein